MKIINDFLEVDQREILDCRVKSIMELSRYYGLKMNSFQIMMIAESVSFHYGKLSIDGIAFKNIPFATASNFAIEDTFFESLNIRCVKKNIGEDYEGLDTLRKLIDRDIPVLFRLDSRALMHGGTIPTETKINVHYLSTLLLVGYDDFNFYVILTNTDVQRTPVKISIDTIQTYRNDQCIPYSPKGECYFIEPLEENEITSDDIDKGVYRGMLNIANVMLNNKELVTDKFEKSVCNDLCSGIKGMCKLGDDLWRILLDLACLKKHLLQDQLSLLFLRNNLMFGSYSGFREEFGKGLISIGQLYNNSNLVRLGTQADKNSKEWKRFLMFVNKAGKNNHILFHTFLAFVCWEKIIKNEKKIFTKLREDAIRNLNYEE